MASAETFFEISVRLPGLMSVPQQTVEFAHQVYRWNGWPYVPSHRVPLAAGPFLTARPDWIEQYVALPPDFWIGIRDGTARNLSAARVSGESMKDFGVLDRDIVIFERSRFSSLDNRHTLVIEKIGEEEGYGAWCLKKLNIVRGRSFTRNEFGDDIDSDNPILELHPADLRYLPWTLDPLGRYRIHGVYRRKLSPGEVRLVDANVIREVAQAGHARPGIQ
jgi:hypothetical protein